MRFRLLRDILIFIALPIFIFNASIINNIQIAFQISSTIVIIYAIFTKIKENRVNTTGILIFFMMMIYLLSNQNLNSDYVYFYNTSIFIFAALIIPGLKVFNKDMGIIVIRDILKSLNINSLAVIRLMKKKSMMQEINQISSMIETGLILISLLRIVNIMNYNGGTNSYLHFTTNCIAVGFATVIIYKIGKIVYVSRRLNIGKNNYNIDKEDNTKGKVINFSSFK